MPIKFTFIFSQTSTSAGGERGCTKLTTIRAVMIKMPEENTPQAIQQWLEKLLLFSADMEFVTVFRWWSRMNHLDILLTFFSGFLSQLRWSFTTMDVSLINNYVLNHEPVHFKNTIFLVDRFHWQDMWDVPVATPSIVIYNLMLPP